MCSLVMSFHSCDIPIITLSIKTHSAWFLDGTGVETSTCYPLYLVM